MAHIIKTKNLTLSLTSASNDRLTDDETTPTASILVPWFEIHFPSGNSGVSYMGGSNVATSNWIPRAAGTTISFTASERGDFSQGDLFNLKNIYIAGTTADKVIVQYPVRDGDSI